MNIFSGSGNSRFSNSVVFRSAFVITLLIGSILYGLVVCHHPSLTDTKGGHSGEGDVKFYQIVIEQIHTGKSYYSVAGNELRRRNYPTSSVFNWRLPTLAWLLGQLPSIRTGQVFAFILALTTLFIWSKVFHRYQYAIWQAILGSLILSGPLCLSLSNFTLFHEFWAGTLISLSLGAYARGWRYVSVAAGLMALFLRELSLPFVCVMMILSYRDGQRREALMWLMGILAFGGELLLHWSIVSQLITENDKTLQGGWIVFGGWPFVLNTAQMHPLFMLSPPWALAIIVPLSLLGVLAWRDGLGIRIACIVGVYMVAFSIVGRSVNDYWGLMYVFVMFLGLLHAPYVLRDLWQPLSSVISNKGKI